VHTSERNTSPHHINAANGRHAKGVAHHAARQERTHLALSPGVAQHRLSCWQHPPFICCTTQALSLPWHHHHTPPPGPPPRPPPLKHRSPPPKPPITHIALTPLLAPAWAVLMAAFALCLWGNATVVVAGLSTSRPHPITLHNNHTLPQYAPSLNTLPPPS
jgi:hypothetical protein